MLALAGCADDETIDVAVPEPRDAAQDASADADSLDEDAGDDAAIDAGPLAPAVVRGEDYVFFPELTPEGDGELIVSFSVPRGARSFVLTVSPASARRVLLVSLRGPGETLLFDALADEPSGPLANATTYNIEKSLAMSVLYPNAPDAPFEPGTYRARIFLDDVASDADATASADIVFGRPIDDAEERALGIQLWVAPGAALNADDVTGDAPWLDAIAEMRSILDTAGLPVAAVGVADLGAADQDLSVIDGPAAVHAILDELEGREGRLVHLVLVDRIMSATGATVQGKTTGIPIAPPHAELARRGAIFISLESLPVEATRTGELLAHEIAHALGLQHTSEADGMHHDPLSDTPQCPADRATFETTSGELLLSVDDCADLDGNNLLFYTSPEDDAEQRLLSADQVWVLTRNPTVF